MARSFSVACSEVTVSTAAGVCEQSTAIRRPLKNLVGRLSPGSPEGVEFSAAARLAASSSSTSKGDFCGASLGCALLPAFTGMPYLRSVPACSMSSRASAAIWGLPLVFSRSSRTLAVSHFLLAT